MTVIEKPTALWIAHVNVLDAEKLGAYAAAATPVIESFGGVFLARGGKYIQLEGKDHTRNVVARFPSLKAAHECYHSEGYQAAIALGEGGFERSLMIVEEVG